MSYQPSNFYGTVITPTVLSAGQSDYNPPGLDQAIIVRVEASGATRTITSIQGGAPGRFLYLQNVGSSGIVALANNSASGTATNRFSLPFTTLQIIPSETICIQYDGTLSRWVLFNRGGVVNTISNQFTTATGTVNYTSQSVSLPNGNTNNLALNPGVNLLILNPVAGAVLTGLSGGTVGRRVILLNNSNTSDDVILSYLDSNSLSANRFSFLSGGVGPTLSFAYTIELIYAGSAWTPSNSLSGV